MSLTVMFDELKVNTVVSPLIRSTFCAIKKIAL